jgi:NAD(P)-dependent dehydrogenase (short-subunit alcohol dehydrogenase family)
MTSFKSGAVGVVTGGSRGIGLAAAQRMASLGMEVVVLDIEPPPHEGLQFLETDVSDVDSVAASFDLIDRVDTLVNNAGIQRVALVESGDVEAWDAVLSVNLRGAFLCSSAAMPHLKASAGSVVSVGSTAARVGLPGRSAYAAAKAGLEGFTRTLAVEGAEFGVRANVVAPGYTATGLVRQGIEDGSLNEDWMLERLPLRRLAEPDEIANAVVYLASEEAAYLTGQVLVVDGGWTVQGISHKPDWLAADGTG